MGIPEQGGDIVIGCSDLRQKRSVAVPYQYVGPLLVAYPLDKVESLLRMGWQVWSQYCCLAVEIFFQGDGRGARSRCKEAVQEKNLTYHNLINNRYRQYYKPPLRRLGADAVRHPPDSV